MAIEFYFPDTPQPPDWRLHWPDLDEKYDWIRAMRNCPQDPIHHAEGDVWIHQEMVLRALIEAESWRNLGELARGAVYWAAMLHDVAKPKTTREEPDGRITARGHSALGTRMAREILWAMDVPFELREWIANIVRYHQVPFWLLERDDAEREIVKISQTTRCDWLSLMAEADIRGRHCQDQQSILDRIALFRELARDQQCLGQARAFASPYGRYQYCLGKWHQPDEAPFEDFICEVLLMSGLPGSGKDYWIEQHGPNWPVISLDAIRQEMNVAPTDKQGPVIREARERAREHLRRKQSFIWNATNISRDMRAQSLQLFEAYRARTTIHYVEASRQTLFRQNADREDAVPEPVLNKLIRRWEVPNPYEAPEVLYHVQHEHDAGEAA